MSDGPDPEAFARALRQALARVASPSGAARAAPPHANGSAAPLSSPSDDSLHGSASGETLTSARGGESPVIGRVTVELALGSERARVELSVRDDRAGWACSCGQENCAHLRAALRTLTEAAQPPAVQRPALQPRPPAPAVAPGPSPGARERRTLHPREPSGAPDAHALAEVLQDLVTAVVRSGVAQGASPSVEEALSRLREAVPQPTPAGVLRFIAGLSHALARRDAGATARALAGASLSCGDFLEIAPSLAGSRRTHEWLGAGPADPREARLADVQLLEVAREQLGGSGSSVERRYLVDLARGTTYCEERVLSVLASLGPCPRLLTVWLAELEESAAPQRVRLLQYAVSLSVEQSHWQTVQSHACTDFGFLLDQARDALNQAPGLAEPFALVAPAKARFGASDELQDSAGRPMLLARPDNPEALRYLEAFARGAELRWVAGRLIDQAGALALSPLSAAVLRHGRLCYAQI